MIVSNNFQFIFLKTRKTAGSSFEFALSRYLSSNDVITPLSPDEEELRVQMGYVGPSNYLAKFHEDPIRVTLNTFRAKQTYRYWNHISARLARRRLPKEVWNSYTKFTLVRNPYELTISRFFWEKRKPKNNGLDFREWLLSAPGILVANRKITHIGEEFVLDAFLKLEDLSPGFELHENRFSLPPGLGATFASIRAKSESRPPASSIERMFHNFPEGIALVNGVFEDEFERYGYERLGAS